MEGIARSFGNRLKQFALSVDNVDDSIFDEIWSLIEDYTKNELEMDYLSFLVEQVILDKPGLRILRCTEAQTLAYPIHNHDGSFNGLTSFSFYTGKPLWIVSPKKKPLPTASEIIDLWSNSTELPKYGLPSHEDRKTCVIMPLFQHGRKFGLLHLEAITYQEPTSIAFNELKLFSETISVLYELYNLNESQKNNTKAAIKELQHIKQIGSWPQLTKPHIFVASSSNADEEVIGIINKVLSEFDDRLKTIVWSDISLSGNINAQVLEHIARAKFGLCYFSEKVDVSDRFEFQDNPNVIFEAGMLHAFTNSPSDVPQSWIPVREASSPKLPFDFASERILIVDRKADGTLNQQLFSENLRKRLLNLLGQD